MITTAEKSLNDAHRAVFDVARKADGVLAGERQPHPIGQHPAHTGHDPHRGARIALARRERRVAQPKRAFVVTEHDHEPDLEERALPLPI